MSVSSIALNGLNQAQATLENVGKRISGAAGRGDAVDLSTDAVNLIQAKSDFEANIKVLEIADEQNKSAIDLLA
jgi:flagellar basal body rod protein FlgG